MTASLQLGVIIVTSVQGSAKSTWAERESRNLEFGLERYFMLVGRHGGDYSVARQTLPDRHITDH
ncbi:MAG: hypothetical protein LC749_10240 [Actinobacteria bacterium]|nr:hypothetical protein [Actinomycetota bacterium]